MIFRCENPNTSVIWPILLFSLWVHASACLTQAQPSLDWQAAFGGSGDDHLQSVLQTSDGGYLLGGNSSSGISGNKTNASYGGNDYWLVKVDASGNKLWEQVFGGFGHEYLTSVRLTSDGGYILGGFSGSDVWVNKTNATFGGYDYWLVKVDSGGNKQWERGFGGDGDDILYSAEPTSDGGYILAGYSNSGASGNKTSATFGSYDYWLVKVDSDGNKQWEKDFGGSNPDHLLSVLPTDDGGYVLGGTSHSGVSGNKTNASYGSGDYWLLKVDGNGNKQWEKAFGGNGVDQLLSVQSTSDGGYVLGGWSESGETGNKTSGNFRGYDYWLVKVDSDGNKQWDKVFGGNDFDFFRSVRPTSDGGYILGGYSVSGESGNKTSASLGFSDYWLVKVDGTGEKQWDLVFGGNNSDELNDAQQTSDGGYILGGTSYSGAFGNKTNASYGSGDYWVVKLKPASPRLEALATTNGVFQLRVSRLSSDLRIVIYAATNLSNWTPIFTNPPVAGTLDYVDLSASNFPQRFYRAALMP